MKNQHPTQRLLFLSGLLPATYMLYKKIDKVLKNNFWEKANNCYTSTLVINLCTRLSLFAIINPTFSLLNFENLTETIMKIHA